MKANEKELCVLHVPNTKRVCVWRGGQQIGVIEAKFHCKQIK